jgi:diguanylate cyclase (GGDEF)-like protein
VFYAVLPVADASRAFTDIGTCPTKVTTPLPNRVKYFGAASKPVRMDVVEFISKQRRSTLVVAGALLLMLVGIGAYFASGQLLESSVFFIIPISFFTWFVGRHTGLIASAVSAAFTLAANAESPMHAVHPHVAYWNALVWLAFFVLITIIIAELKVLYLRERQLSRVDNLTGVATRLAFYEVAEGEKNRAKRYRHSITLAYLDLDRFKEVNDSMGHAVGDRVLVTVARTIESSIRQTDTVARMGGDEFAIILPNTGKDAAGRVLSKVLRVLDEAMLQGGYPVTFSIGAVTFLTPAESLQEMIRQADRVMYSIKSTGKNRLEQKELTAS